MRPTEMAIRADSDRRIQDEGLDRSGFPLLFFPLCAFGWKLCARTELVFVVGVGKAKLGRATGLSMGHPPTEPVMIIEIA